MPESSVVDMISSQSREVISLVERARSGDRDAQGQLVLTYEPLIKGIAMRYLRSFGDSLARRLDVDDLVQEALIRFITKLEHHEWKGRPALKSWVANVAKNAMRDERRAHMTQKRDLKKEDFSLHPALQRARKLRSIESEIQLRSDKEEMNSLIQGLKEDDQIALRMHMLGSEWAEIGEALEISAEAARKRCARVIAKLGRARVRAEEAARSVPQSGIST